MGQAKLDTFLCRRKGLDSTQAKPAVNQLFCWQVLYPSPAITAKGGLLSGLCSSPLSQTGYAGKPVISFILPWELLGPSCWRANAMKNYGVSELRQWHEQLIAANTGVLGWSLLVRDQKSCIKSWLCAVEREQPISRAWMLSSLGWQIWEFLNENNSLRWCFHFYCIQENGPWVKFFLPFGGCK